MTTRIAFQGRKGAYSEQAVLEYFPKAQPVSFETFEDILKAVSNDCVNFAMLPVENTLGGTVLPACLALIDSELHPLVEYTVPIHHVLMAPKGVGKITRVLSHPQALAQCAERLKSMAIESVPFFDTAGAAEHLSKNPEPHAGAIASLLAAQQYGLEILQDHLEDRAFNQTRFLLIGKFPGVFESTARYKTSLSMRLHNKPNALASVLNILGEAGVNLTKIESHPTREGPWEYWFFMDMMGHVDQEPLKTILTKLCPLLLSFHIIGSYKIDLSKQVES